MDYYFTYYVIFKSNAPNQDGPIVTYSSANKADANPNGTMHLFDEDLFDAYAKKYL